MKTISKRSVKLYDGLAPKQLAVLTLQSMANMDTSEVDKIRAAVPWKRYDCIDAAYTDWRDAFHTVVLLWTCEYWRQLFMHAATLSRLQSSGGDPSGDGQLQRGIAQQRAHWKVLHALCKAHGLDDDAVLKLVGVPHRCDALDDDDIDEAFYQQWYDDLSACLPSA